MYLFEWIKNGNDMTRKFSYGIIYVAIFLGGGSLLTFVLFTFWGPFKVVVISSSDQMALLVDTVLSLIFFLQHSIMIRQFFRDKLSQLMPENYYSAFFAIISGMVLIGVIFIWQKTNQLIVEADGIFYWTMRILFFISIAGFYWGSKALGSFDPFGIRAILGHQNPDKPDPLKFKIKGPYRWVRHPLYTFTLIMIWSHPYLTADRLLFNILWTVWIVTGTVFEERDLLDTFGDEYKAYQKNVPMLVPFKKPVNER